NPARPEEAALPPAPPSFFRTRGGGLEASAAVPARSPLLLLVLLLLRRRRPVGSGLLSFNLGEGAGRWVSARLALLGSKPSESSLMDRDAGSFLFLFLSPGDSRSLPRLLPTR
ncbi:unnamed protein product, partial [Ectocarpus sp. 13 AM-2016]